MMDCSYIYRKIEWCEWKNGQNTQRRREVWIPEHMLDGSIDCWMSTHYLPSIYFLLESDTIEEQDGIKQKVNDSFGSRSHACSVRRMLYKQERKLTGPSFSLFRNLHTPNWTKHFYKCRTRPLHEEFEEDIIGILNNLFDGGCVSPIFQALGGKKCRECPEVFDIDTSDFVTDSVMYCFGDIVDSIANGNYNLLINTNLFKEWLFRLPCFKKKSLSNCYIFVFYLATMCKLSNLHLFHIFKILFVICESLKGRVFDGVCPGHYILSPPGTGKSATNKKFLLGYIDTEYLYLDFAEKPELIKTLCDNGISVMTNSWELNNNLDIAFGVRIFKNSAARVMKEKFEKRELPPEDVNLLSHYRILKRHALRGVVRARKNQLLVEYTKQDLNEWYKAFGLIEDAPVPDDETETENISKISSQIQKLQSPKGVLITKFRIINNSRIELRTQSEPAKNELKIFLTTRLPENQPIEDKLPLTTKIILFNVPLQTTQTDVAVAEKEKKEEEERLLGQFGILTPVFT